MRIDQSRLRRPGIAAATAALLVAGVVGSVGVAGARENTTIYSVENGGVNPCFSTAKKTTCTSGERPVVTIQTGDKVTWDMSTGTHNAASKSANPADTVWMARQSAFDPTKPQDYTFGKEGTYEFVCQAHAGMEGTIIVEGAPVETPTPSVTSTPTSSATASPTFAATVAPTATAAPDDHLTTPAPGKGAKDTQAPLLQRAQVKSASGGAKLRFWVSEPATVEVTVRRGKSTVTSATLHVAAGTRSVVVRSSSLRRKGTYTFEWRAVDAMANKSNVVKKTLKVKR